MQSALKSLSALIFAQDGPLYLQKSATLAKEPHLGQVPGQLQTSRCIEKCMKHANLPTAGLLVPSALAPRLPCLAALHTLMLIHYKGDKSIRELTCGGSRAAHVIWAGPSCECERAARRARPRPKRAPRPPSRAALSAAPSWHFSPSPPPPALLATRTRTCTKTGNHSPIAIDLLHFTTNADLTCPVNSIVCGGSKSASTA